GQLMAGVGLVELVVAGVCLVGRRERLSLVLVGWLSGNFALYRLGLWWMGWKRPCGCLGHLTDALGVSPTVADRVMIGVLAYLGVGAFSGLFWTKGHGVDVRGLEPLPAQLRHRERGITR
ncbi:MauE/DoxX family redox-associated membrane protein, partial [Limisphaera sp. 4302-co]|uniref:MauE/DoxX family redox-associated membrane protein n=1 Tax=Limisphaera sp. 4302-co TaxID=3400417 RepID=UPI003C23AE1F